MCQFFCHTICIRWFFIISSSPALSVHIFEKSANSIAKICLKKLMKTLHSTHFSRILYRYVPKTGFRIFRFATNYCCMAWNKENPYFLKVETESDYSAKFLRCYFFFIVRRSRLQTIIDFVNLWFNRLYDKVFKVHMLEICFW